MEWLQRHVLRPSKARSQCLVQPTVKQQNDRLSASEINGKKPSHGLRYGTETGNVRYGVWDLEESTKLRR